MNRSTKNSAAKKTSILARCASVACSALLLSGGVARANDNFWTGASNFSWSTTSANWNLSPFVWDNSFVDAAIFNGANPGTISVNTDITLRAVAFLANGYTINGPNQLFFNTGGSSSLANGVVLATSGVTGTINANLLCIIGLHKQGAGTIILGGNNSFGALPPQIDNGKLVLNSSTAGGTVSILPITIGSEANGSNSVLSYGSGLSGTDLTVRAGVAVRRSYPVTVASTANTSTTAGIDLGGASPMIYSDWTLNRPITITGAGNQMGRITGPGAGTGNDTIIFNGSVAPGAVTNLVPKDDGTNSFANTYSGNLRVQTGILQIQQLSYIADIAANNNLNIPDTASVTVDAGASLRLVWGDETIDALRGAGNVTRITADSQGVRTLTIGASNGSGTFSGVIDSLFNITKTGSGTQIFSGANTYAGATTISAGTLQIGDGGTTGSVSGNITTNASLVFNRSNAYTYAGSISGIGSLTNSGAGTLALTGSNSYTGGTTLAGGTINVGAVNALGTSGNIRFTGGTLQYSAANQVDYSSRIVNSSSAIAIDTNGQNATFASALGSSNTGGLTKSGTGTLTLSGFNTFTGVTTVNTGVLDLARPGSDSNGTISGVVSVNSGATLRLSAVDAAGYSANRITTLNINSLGLVDHTAAGNQLWGVTINMTGSNLRSNGGVDSDTTASVITLGGGSSINSLANSNTSLIAGRIILREGNASDTVPINVADGGAAIDLNITAAIGQFGAGGTKSITKQGTGTLQLSGPNDNNSLLLNAQAGTVLLNKQNVPGSRAVAGISNIGSGATVKIVGGATSDQIYDGDGVFGVVTMSGGTLDLAGASEGFDILSGTGTVTNSTASTTSVLTLGTANGSGTFGGTIADGAGTVALTKTGTGTLTLTSPSSYTGATIISGGTLVLNGPNQLNGGLQPSAAVTVNAGATLLIASANGYAGYFNAPHPTLTLNAGAVATTGNEIPSHVKKITLAGGELRSGTPDPFFGSWNFNDTITATGNTTSTITAQGVVLNNTISFVVDAGSTLNVTGSFKAGDEGGALEKQGSGTLILAAANSYTGVTTVSQGVLKLTAAGAVNAASPITVQSSGILQLSTNDIWGNHATTTSSKVTVQAGGILKSAGVFNTLVDTQLSGGTVELNGGVNSNFGALAWKGTVTIDGTALSAVNVIGGSFNTINIGTVNAPGVTTFDVADVTGNANADFTVNAVIKNNLNVAAASELASGLTKTGAGLMVLTAANTYTGGTTISNGTLQIGAGGTTGSVSGNITNNGALVFNRSDAHTYAGSISGIGSLTQNGTGTLTLTGSNSYTGGTTIQDGTIVLGSAGALPSGAALTVAQGTLDLKGNSASVGNLIMGDTTLIGNRTVIDSLSSGTALTVSGNISYIGTSGQTGNRGTINVPLSLPTGQHEINTPNNFLSNGRYDLIFNGPIGGAGGLTLNALQIPGGSTCDPVLNAINTYLGPTIITSGELFVGQTNGLPSTTDVTINGGFLSLNPNATTGGVTTGSYNQTIRSLSGTSGTVILGAATLTLNQTTNTTFGGAISGTGRLTKAGTGMLTLSGTNTHTGGTTISGGIINAASTGALGTTGNITFTGGKLQYSAANQVDYSSRILNSTGFIWIDTNGQNVTFASALASSNTGGLFKTGTGSLTLAGTNNFGPTFGMVDNGILNINSGVSANFAQTVIGFNVGSIATLNVAGGTLTSTSYVAVAYPNSTGTLNITAGGTVISSTGYIGFVSNSTGFVNLTNGTWNNTYSMNVGSVGAGTLNINSGGTVSSSTIEIGTSAAGIVNLNNGATLITSEISKGNGTASFDFNGGTLRASATTSNLFSNFSPTINTGGANIDTNGFDATINSALVHKPSLGATQDGGLTKTGAGTLTLTAANTYTGNTTVSDGILKITGTYSPVTPGALVVSGTGLASIDGGTATFSSVNATGLLITNSGKLVIATQTTTPITAANEVLNSFAINTGGQLDITNNALIVHSTDVTDSFRSAIQGIINSGQNGFDNNGQVLWNGPGIVSSTARANNVAAFVDVFTIGIIKNRDLININGGPGIEYGPGNPWLGSVSTVGTDDILIRMTYSGDTNLDGTVTIDDYNNIDGTALGLTSNFGWVSGDFDFNGVITIDDYNAIDTGYLYQGGQLTQSMVASRTAMFGAEYVAHLEQVAAGFASVPEPAVVGLLGLGGFGLLAGRKRRK